MGIFIDRTGNRYGTLTVTGFVEFFYRGKSRRSRWRCLCDCGRETIIDSTNLIPGRSCGCREGFFSHRKSGTVECRIWYGIIKRCTCPTFKQWADYGGRGISVCAKWRTFEGFFADVGPRPSPAHTIERIDNDGNYEPGNCRWATRREQNQNTRKNIFVTVDGMRMVMAEAVRLTGLTQYKLRRYFSDNPPASYFHMAARRRNREKVVAQ